MKTIKLFSTLLLSATICMVSCSDDNEPNIPAGGEPVTATGAIVVCNGAAYSGIPGSVTTFDFNNSKTTLSAFAAANNRNLGTSANQALVYGDYVFITSTDENTVEIANKNTMVSVKSLRMVEAFGEDKGDKPRCLAAHDGKVYISTFTGYICCIDARTFEPKGTFKAGSYPEGMAFSNSGMLYVANSDYGMNTNPSVSVINLADGTSTEIKSPMIQNPTDLYNVAGRIFLLDKGSYDADWNQKDSALYEIKADNSLVKVCDATMAAANDQTILVCNAPFHTPVLTPTYAKYDVASSTVSSLDISVDSPAFVGISPTDGNYFVGSYNIDPQTHYALYNDNGYVAVFSGTEKKYTFECGVGPVAITFNTK